MGLKLDKYLSECGDIACQNIMYWHAQMMINGSKYGVSLFLHVQQNFQKDEIEISEDLYIKPLREFSMTLYGKEYYVVFDQMKKKEDEDNVFDLIYTINDEQYTVNDVVFDPENKDYVDFGVREKKSVELLHEYSFDGDVESVRSDLPAKFVKMPVAVG